MKAVAWFLLFIFLSEMPQAFAEQGSIEVTTQRLGFNRVKLAGNATIKAPVETVWQVLTDYNHLDEFIPGLTESWMAKQKEGWFFTQKGRAEWWVFTRDVEVTFLVEEEPMKQIHFKAIAGDFKEHQGAWRVEPQNGTVRIVYEATIRPHFFMPPFVGKMILRRQLEGSLRAIAARAEGLQA